MLERINRGWARLQFTDSVRISMYRKISKMLSNGLPLLKILEELRDRASDQGKKPGEPLAIVLDDCRRMVQNGRLLSEGLERWAPKSEQMIILAGEQSGRLEKTLLAVVEVVVNSRKIKSVIVSGIAYPISVVVLITVYMWLFGTKVIPEFARIVDPTQWKGPAHSLYVMSLWVQHWMIITVIGIAAAIGALFASMPLWRGNVRVFFDRFAPYSIYRLVIGSGFLTAFSALQSAGVTVERSLMLLSGMSTPWLRERLDGALLGVRSGLNCGEAMRASGYGFPSKEVIDDLCVYAEYRGFSEALKMLADEWMMEGVENIALKMKIVNGFAIVTLAIVISWLVTGFFGIQQEIAAIARAAG